MTREEKQKLAIEHLYKSIEAQIAIHNLFNLGHVLTMEDVLNHFNAKYSKAKKAS